MFYDKILIINSILIETNVIFEDSQKLFSNNLIKPVNILTLLVIDLPSSRPLLQSLS